MSAIVLIGKLLTVILGLLIAYRGYQGYQRTSSQPMLFISVGFVFISAGGALGCSIQKAIDITVPLASLLQPLLIGVGMVSILYSMYV